WKDECQHVLLDELELKRLDATLSPPERDRAVTDFIELVVAVDGILQQQAQADVQHFVAACGRAVGAAEADAPVGPFLKAYRWQDIFWGGTPPRFQKSLKVMISEPQFARIEAALATLNQS